MDDNTVNIKPVEDPSTAPSPATTSHCTASIEITDDNEGMTIDDDVAADSGTDEDGEVQMNDKDAED